MAHWRWVVEKINKSSDTLAYCRWQVEKIVYKDGPARPAQASGAAAASTSATGGTGAAAVGGGVWGAVGGGGGEVKIEYREGKEILRWRRL